MIYLVICTKDFSLRLAPSRVRASNAETIEEIIRGESVDCLTRIKETQDCLTGLNTGN